MIISHSHKFIFVKTRKTAGSSLERVIYDNFFDPEIDICCATRYNDQIVPQVNTSSFQAHMSHNDIKRMIGYRVWGDYTTFTIERNPWDKVSSHYFWKYTEASFDNFISEEFEEFMHFSDWHRYAEHEEIAVDHVIRYEKLNSELPEFFNNVLGLPLTSEMLQGVRYKSGFRKSTYQQLFETPRQIDLVAEIFANEIKHFGYEF